MKSDIIESFVKLKMYCEKEQFKGWDPYDGLNSKLFQKLPFFKNSAVCRLVMIQTFKRCPFNLRPLFLVPKGYNAKGIALLLQGYCNLCKCVEANDEIGKKIGSKEEIISRINELALLLISLQSKGYSGACWGYNFDWQARLLFLFPKNTPTVVATTFCATALFDAYELTQNNLYLETALSAADFIAKDLHRTTCNDGFLFSYSPLNGNDTVYNASLMGSKLLSFCYHYSGNEEYKTLARHSVVACCNAQQRDGAWVYGMLSVQSWIDSFHTGYNLDGLIAYKEQTDDASFSENIERGFQFYIENFFEDNGVPKYYYNKMYPIDIHCPAQLFVTLSRLHKFEEYKELAEKVVNWTLTTMQDKKGFFYYQVKKGINSKISYMRWSNAFMFNALSYYILELCKNTK